MKKEEGSEKKVDEDCLKVCSNYERKWMRKFLAFFIRFSFHLLDF